MQNATALSGNVVIGRRFDSSEISGQFTKIVAYGTAVSFKPASSERAGGVGLSVWALVWIGVAVVLVIAAVMIFFSAGTGSRSRRAHWTAPTRCSSIRPPTCGCRSNPGPVSGTA